MLGIIDIFGQYVFAVSKSGQEVGIPFSACDS